MSYPAARCWRAKTGCDFHWLARKTSCRCFFDGSRIGLPLAGAPSSHILKPAIHAFQYSVINEGFCMALADVIQLKPARSKVHRVLDCSFLLVEHYDRLTDREGYRQRLHQEDFCQALGVMPEMKYQNEGGPDLAQCTADFANARLRDFQRVGGQS